MTESSKSNEDHNQQMLGTASPPEICDVGCGKMKNWIIAVIVVAVLGSATVLLLQWNLRHVNTCFSFGFAAYLAENSAELGGKLPETPAAFVAWRKAKGPDVDWPTNAYAHLYEIQWGMSLTNLTEDSLVTPPTIIKCKPTYLKDAQVEVNRAFARHYLDHIQAKAANKSFVATGVPAPQR